MVRGVLNDVALPLAVVFGRRRLAVAT